ncbi:hypothetical protein NC651_005730 [Populus alba x Populus x berolinensis]|nr:hypothetical protein NC651_005730 [Populus alba x Populus x berolinensis]
MQDWLGSMHRALKPLVTRESIGFWSRICSPFELSNLASCLNGKKTSVANGVRPWTQAAATAILRYNHCTRPFPLIIMSTSRTFAATLPLRLAWRAKHELAPYVPSNHGKATCGSNKEPSYKEKRHFRPSSQNSNITRRRDRALLNSRIWEKVNTDMRKSLLYHENARWIKEEAEEPEKKSTHSRPGGGDNVPDRPPSLGPNSTSLLAIYFQAWALKVQQISLDLELARMLINDGHLGPICHLLTTPSKELVAKDKSNCRPN